MFTLTSSTLITQTDATSSVYDSETTYSAGDIVSFDGLFYKFDPFVAQTGARMTFTTDETFTNRNAQLDFSQVIFSTFTNLAFNTTNGIGVDSPSAVSFGGRRFYRTNGSNALTVKVTQWTSLINTDGILTATADISGTDPFIDLYNANGSNMTLPTVTGTVRFGSSVAATQTSATTSGDPSTDTDNWDLTIVGDADLKDLQRSAFDSSVTRTFDGTKYVYTFNEDIQLFVEGTIIINPEINKLATRANNAIQIKSGGSLQFGEKIPTFDGERFSEGVAWSNTLAQVIWYGLGNNQSLIVQSGGTLIYRGATTISPGVPGIGSGGEMWVEKGTHICKDFHTGVQIDPINSNTSVSNTTGATVLVANDQTGVNKNVSTNANNGALNQLSRGYVGWIQGGGYRWDDWTLVGGGEYAFTAIASGTNVAATAALGSTQLNGIFGYGASGCRVAVLAEKGLGTAVLRTKNTQFSGRGNFKDLSIQSTSGGNLTNFFATNEVGGSNMGFDADVAKLDVRNFGFAQINREVNFNIADGLTGSSVSDGLVFMRDINNHERKTLNSKSTYSDDFTYNGTLVGGSLASDLDVVLKVVNVFGTASNRRPNNDNGPHANDRSSDVTRTTATTLTLGGDAVTVGDRIVFEVTTSGGVLTYKAIIATAGQTPYSVNTLVTDTIKCYQVFAAVVVDSVTYNNIPWVSDLRTKSNNQGTDTFDFLYAHPEYNLTLLTTDVTDGTIGTITIPSNILPDADYSDTSSSKTQANNLDELYDLIKQEKCTLGTASSNNGTVAAVASNNNGTASGVQNKFPVEYPTLTTLFVTKSGELLDIGTRSFAVDTTTTGQFTRVLESSLVAHSGSTAFGVGSTFKGLTTSDDISLNNILLSGGIIFVGASITDLPTTIGASTLSPIDELLAGTGGHTVSSTSVMNADLTITGTSKNVFGGTINGDVDLKGGDTDFNGPVDEVGGITTGDILLNSSSLRTIDFKSGSLTKGKIEATTVTNLVLDGTHEKLVTRSVGTATTNASGSVTGVITLGAGVLTTGSTFIAGDTVTAGAGIHSVAGTIAKKLTLGNGASTVDATVSTGGLTMGTGAQTINGNITGAVLSTGTLTTSSTFRGTSTVTANTATGDSDIDGEIVGNVLLGNASVGHKMPGAISVGSLTMGTGAHIVNGTVKGLITTTGTITTGLVFSGESTLTAGAGNSTIRGSVTGLLTLGAGNQTIAATLSGGATLGNGAHTIDGTLTGPISTGNGNTALNGQLTGNLTDGTGTLTFGPSASMTGTLTKNGSLIANGLTLTSAQAATVTLVVTTGTLELYGAVRADFAGVTGNTHDNVATTSTVFQVDSALPTGRVIFKDRASSSWYILKRPSSYEWSNYYIRNYN